MNKMHLTDLETALFYWGSIMSSKQAKKLTNQQKTNHKVNKNIYLKPQLNAMRKVWWRYLLQKHWKHWNICQRFSSTWMLWIYVYYPVSAFLKVWLAHAIKVLLLDVVLATLEF